MANSVEPGQMSHSVKFKMTYNDLFPGKTEKIF